MESWRNRKTLILSRTDMMGLVTPAEYVSCVEQAYRMHGEGRYYMDPKGHIVLDKYPGEWEAMPSYIEEPEAAACKWVSIRERNREKFDLPTVFSILIYTHPETGFPLAICDGSHHTVMRTGAAAAVSAKWLARKNSKKLAIVGAGHMAEGALATCNEVFAWEEVRVWSRSQSDARPIRQGASSRKYPRFKISLPRTSRKSVRGADVVVTVTPARGPIVKDEWIAPGTHIAALGADKARRPGARSAHRAARAHLRRRHPPVPHRRRDQRAAVAGPDPRAGHRRRDRRGDHRQEDRAAPPTTRSRCSTPPASRCRTRPPSRSSTSGRVAAGVGIEKKMIST